MSGWTDQRVERLKLLHKQGLSASQIAKLLTGVTRNAVIGKCVRLGLGSIGGGRASAPTRGVQPGADSAPVRRHAGKPRSPLPKGVGFVLPSTAPPRGGNPLENRLASIQANNEVRAVAAVAPAPVEEAPTATILDLGKHTCRWPIGDPLHPAFGYCGRRRDEKATYCVEHAAVAYQAVPISRKNAKPRTGNELMRSLRRYI